MTETLTAPKPVAQKRAGKIYQCNTPGYTLVIDNNDNPWTNVEGDERVVHGAANLTFNPVVEPLTGKVFSEIASDAPILAKKVQIVTFRDPDGKVRGTRDATPEEIEAFIENSKAYKDTAAHKTIGIRGIWLKTERQKQLQQEVGTPGGVTASSVYDRMSDPVLQLHIETEGGTYPIKSESESEAAYHAKLVEVAVELESKK